MLLATHTPVAEHKTADPATYYCEIHSPVGPLLLVGSDALLQGIYFQAGSTRHKPEQNWVRRPSVFRSLTRQLKEYFDGQRHSFDVSLSETGTPFQRLVWQALRALPYGSTVSYGELARRIRKPKAVRAVGGANGANPWPIVVPCHRVIGADRSLIGFGGGIEIKYKLLLLEAEHGGEAWPVPPPALRARSRRAAKRRT
jgi:methylated-DNA-[protein]-cysteine S-methyltransferase